MKLACRAIRARARLDMATSIASGDWRINSRADWPTRDHVVDAVVWGPIGLGSDGTAGGFEADPARP